MIDVCLLFDVERKDPNDASKTITESRMKLARGSSIKNDYWNTTSNGNGYNDWTTATLKTYLNTEYYNSLQTSSKDLIDEAKYYLGAVSYDSTNDTFGTTEKIYREERGNMVCPACNNDTSKLTWQGNVGLMYPSDVYMVYGNGVNETCYTNPKEGGCQGTNAQTGWVYNSNKASGSDGYWHLMFSTGIASFIQIVSGDCITPLGMKNPMKFVL